MGDGRRRQGPGLVVRTVVGTPRETRVGHASHCSGEINPSSTFVDPRVTDTQFKTKTTYVFVTLRVVPRGGKTFSTSGTRLEETPAGW